MVRNCSSRVIVAHFASLTGHDSIFVDTPLKISTFWLGEIHHTTCCSQQKFAQGRNPHLHPATNTKHFVRLQKHVYLCSSVPPAHHVALFFCPILGPAGFFVSCCFYPFLGPRLFLPCCGEYLSSKVFSFFFSLSRILSRSFFACPVIDLNSTPFP